MPMPRLDHGIMLQAIRACRYIYPNFLGHVDNIKNGDMLALVSFQLLRKRKKYARAAAGPLDHAAGNQSM